MCGGMEAWTHRAVAEAREGWLTADGWRIDVTVARSEGKWIRGYVQRTEDDTVVQ